MIALAHGFDIGSCLLVQRHGDGAITPCNRVTLQVMSMYIFIKGGKTL